jgi:hypothetical protein
MSGRKVIFEWLVYFLLLTTGIGCNEKEYAVPADPNELLRIVADRNAKCSGVVKAAQRLGPVTEPPDFWTRVANSAEYTKRHRRVAVIELFRRHVKPGMSLAELGDVLDRAIWLNECTVTALETVYAIIPLRGGVLPGAFAILVFPEIPGDMWRIYLRVSEHLEVDTFLSALRGEDVEERVADTRIIEIGIDAMGYGEGVYESTAGAGDHM